MGILLASLLVTATVTTLYLYLPQAWDNLTRRYLDDLSTGLRTLGINDQELPTFMRWWGIALATVAVTCWLLVGVPALGIILGYLIYIAPRLLLSRRLRYQRTLLRDQLVTACQMLANTSRAGMGLPAALKQVAGEIPAPLGRELNRVVSEYDAGLPMAESLKLACDRLQLESFTIFTCALQVTLEQGGRLTEALDRISRSLQENQRLERKMEADTAAGRHAILVLTLFPVCFLALAAIMDPEGVGMVFTSIVGQVILLVVFALVLFSVRWAAAIYGRLQST